jgi:hypothetical protein
LEFDELGGDFDQLDLPQLSALLNWNATRLYTDGILMVVSMVFPGDYNSDGTVDAADNVVWKNNDGTQSGYDTWRTNFGRTTGNRQAAPGSAGGSNLAAPVPASLTFAWIAIASLAFASRARYAGRHVRCHADPVADRSWRSQCNRAAITAGL